VTLTHEPLLIEEFRTGLQATRITLLPSGNVHWQHTPGSERTSPYPPLPPGYPDLLRAASDTTVRFAVPVTASPGAYGWETEGRHSFAALLEPGAPDTGGRLHTVAGHLGRRLRALHETALPHDDYPPPQGLSRLKEWIETGGGPRAASGFHYRLRTQLGAARWEKLRDLTHHQLTPGPGEPSTVLHGWFSLGSAVVSDRPGATTAASVLSGPDAASGRPGTDLGCVVGELTEYRLAAARQGLDWPLLDTLQAAFLTGYGPCDRGTLAAGALLRIATHAHDFASYVGWGDQLHGYVPMLLDLLDTDGRLALTTA